MTPTRRAALAQSGHRFSEQIMRQRKRMVPKSVKQFSEQIMRQKKRMTWKGAAPQTREA
jgi:hypothetical protein